MAGVRVCCADLHFSERFFHNLFLSNPFTTAYIVFLSLPLLHLFSRLKLTTTSVAPNSWAAISLWRRFFALQEAELEERQETILKALEEAVRASEADASNDKNNKSNNNPSAIQEDAWKESQRLFYYRLQHTGGAQDPLSTGSIRPAFQSARGRTARREDWGLTDAQTECHGPFLGVPSGNDGEFVHVAQ